MFPSSSPTKHPPDATSLPLLQPQIFRPWVSGWVSRGAPAPSCASGFQLRQRFPAVPAVSSCGAARQVALGLRASGRRGRGACGRDLQRRDGRSGAFRTSVAGSSICRECAAGQRGRVAGEVRPRCRGQPEAGAPFPEGVEAPRLSICSITANPRGRGIYPQVIIPRGKCLHREGNIYTHTVTPTRVNGNYVCKSPNSSVQR